MSDKPQLSTSAYRVEMKDLGVMVITFTRADRLNALTQMMKRDLIELMTRVQERQCRQ